MPTISENETLLQWAHILFAESPGVHELRALGTRQGTNSGYFDNAQDFAKAAAQIDCRVEAEGVYFTLNPCKPELLARATNRVKGYVKHTTSDSDIVRRAFLAVDFDAKRPAGISSTEAEHQAALGRALEARAWLSAQGWPDSLLGDSGNGAHLLCHVDLPNDKDSIALLRDCLLALDLQFSDDAVVVDRTTYNAARLWKTYGTLARKGDPTPERPHRRAALLAVPGDMRQASLELLKELAARLPTQPAKASKAGAGRDLDLDAWIAQSGLNVVSTGAWGEGGRKWVLNPCPWNADHNNRAAYIVQFANGAIAAGCHHNSCQGKGWPELRDVVEPGWRDKGSKHRRRRKGATEEDSDEGRQGRQGAAADRAIQYVLETGAELFHDQHGDGFIVFENNDGRREVWPLKSKAASEFIRWRFYINEGKGLSGDALATTRGTLAAQARFKGECRHLSLRVARLGDTIWYDLGNWRAVALTVDGWVIVDSPPVLFRHYPHQTPQSEPESGGSLEPFFGLLNIRDPEMRLLMEVYLVAALLPDIPAPILVVHGEQGSAKSTLFKLLRALLDPSSLGTLSPPDNLREFVQLAAHHRSVYLDNLNSLPDWLSDAFCRLCTGEGFSKRELYTDDDDIVYSFRGLGGVNGINLVATRPDPLDRAIILKLNAIPEGERVEEQVLWARFEEMKPSILGSMFNALVEAMRRYPHIKLERAPRLADFAHWGAAIAEALGYTADAFLRAYGVNVAAQTEAALEESLVAQAILGFLGFLKEGAKWKGTATELLEELERRAEELHINMRAKSWPKGANILARRLREVAPSLRRIGVEVTEHRAQGVRRWALTREGEEKTAPIATIAAVVAGPPMGAEGAISPPAPSIPPPRALISPPIGPLGSFGGGDSGDGGDIFPAPSGDVTEEDVGEV